MSSVHGQKRTRIGGILILVLQSYDYTLEKVKMYTRVPLGDIVGITKGRFAHIVVCHYQRP